MGKQEVTKVLFKNYKKGNPKMYKKLHLVLLFFSVSLLGFSSLNSQEMPGVFVQENKYLGNNTSSYTDVSGVNVVPEKTQAQLEIEQEILQLKSQDNPANRDRISELDKQLGIMTGQYSTKLSPYNGGGARLIDQQIDVTDDITNIRIFNTAGRTIKGMGTFTEQRGANIGRIWVVYAFSANTTSPDSLRWVYSNNGGLTWIGYANGWLGGTDKINYEDLDIEIIENTTGAKYLWTVYGLRQSGGTGKWFTGGVILNITSFAAGFFGLSWPGDDAAKRYYNVRITSDNAYWAGAAYTYIICSFDSLNTSNYRINTQKYVRCTSPYTTTPTFSYQGPKFWWFQGTSGPANYFRELYSDIAYFRNGSDSVIVSYSGIPDSTAIFFAKANISGTPSTGSGSSSQQGSEGNAYKTWARISTNGSTNGSVICVFRQFYPSNWNIKYFRTTNFGNFSTVFQSALWGSSVNTSYQPDIIGVRNGNAHYFSFMTLSSSDSVKNIKVTIAGTVTVVNKVNVMPLTSTTQGPKPGYRFVNGDSCFTLYSETGPYNVWAALGCSGSITGVNNNNNNIPNAYSLSQNFPNPFNPATNIRYALPKAGIVKLVIYDVLGKEVAIPVNEFRTAGSYELNFDASHLASGVYFYTISAGDFTDTKKMLLIK
ncbi:MAG: T9SS C-terminal target domain-containing protein [Ignavibacteriae bacterium]|nr:MAG: T9SS C-terminal target domain-containing protein [Ignavibacteriota bacterium]